MPRILKTLETVALKLTGGSPASDKVIVSDADGNASWQKIVNANVDTSAGIQFSKMETGSPNQIVRANASGVGEFAYLAVDVPIGTVVPYLFPTPPVGFLSCDGSTLSRNDYADLFALANSAGLIGTMFGAGDGSTTFTLPDMQGRTIVGVGTHSDVSALGASDNLAASSRTPKHTHTVPAHDHTVPAHYHGRGTLGVSVSGTVGTTNIDHVHYSGNGQPIATHVGGYSTAPSGSGAATVSGIVNATAGMSANANHSHTFSGSATTSGSIGNTSGSDGDSSLTTSGESLTSDVTTVPYIALNYIIKATYSTLLGDSHAEASEAFTVFMGN
jgi:microcystin-dependent protein